MPRERVVALHPSGMRAELVNDGFGGGADRGVTLEIGGLAQSHVFPCDPTSLLHDYVQWLASVVDRVAGTGQPIRVLHLGAGALTLVRYVAATRPGSTQVVIESEHPLVEFVLEHVPLADPVGIRFEVQDARAGLDRASGDAPFDVIISDVYAGATTPPHLLTVEFFAQLLSLLAPEGVLGVNVADDEGLPLARAVAATLHSTAAEVLVAGPRDLVESGAEGNAVLLASRSTALNGWVAGLLRAGPQPAAVVGPHELAAFIGGASALHDTSDGCR